MKDLRPVTETAKDAVDAAIFKIDCFSHTAHETGLLSLILMLDKKKLEDRNNLFEYGIAMVCNGFDREEIEDILHSVRQNKDATFTERILDNLYIIGVLGIQAGLSPVILTQKLDAHVPEQCRSERLKKRITEINLRLVTEEGFPRVYLHPEETITEFEKLATLTDEQIQKIMRNVDTETLVWAVRDNEKMKGVFYHNMSGSCVAMMEIDIKDIQDNKTKDAQKRIVTIAEQLKFI
jgi:flagellar motor switch protein FliG